MGCVSERGALLAARWGTQAVQQMNPELGESTTLDGASMDVCINFAQFIGWWGVFKARSYAATQNLRSTPLAPECVCAHARRASDRRRANVPCQFVGTTWFWQKDCFACYRRLRTIYEKPIFVPTGGEGGSARRSGASLHAVSLASALLLCPLSPSPLPPGGL